MGEEDFRALARGRGGRAVVRALRLARRSRTLLLIRLLVEGAPEARPSFDLLAHVCRHAPDAAGRVLDHPWVQAWATRTVLALRRGGRARPEELVFTAAAAAIRGGMAAKVVLPEADAVPLPSLGVVRGARGPVEVLQLAVDPVPEVAVDGRTVFQLDRWPAGGVPAGVPVAGFDVGRWREGIVDAWRVLTRDQPEAAAEFAEAVRVITPMSAPRTGTSSATAANAFGCVFLSLAPDPESVALTLMHEVQHTKLAALMDLFALAEPDTSEVFYAPWRDDPRPVVGLLHGTYAHLGVARFWRGRPGERARVEYARWRMAALTGAETLLSSGKLTAAGEVFTAEMAGVLREWCQEPVDPRAQRAAEREAAVHRARWEAAHGRRTTGRPRR